MSCAIRVASSSYLCVLATHLTCGFDRRAAAARAMRALTRVRPDVAAPADELTISARTTPSESAAPEREARRRVIDARAVSSLAGDCHYHRRSRGYRGCRLMVATLSDSSVTNCLRAAGWRAHSPSVHLDVGVDLPAMHSVSSGEVRIPPA